MSGGYSGVNNATTAATSAAIAASLASGKAGTISPSALQSKSNSRKISPSPAYDLRQSHGNSSIALSSAAAAAKSVSSKPLPSDNKSAGNGPLNIDNVNAGSPAIKSQAHAAGAPRININGMQQLYHPREQHYQLNASSIDAPRGRDMNAGSAIRSPSAAATAAAQSANRHQVETLAINSPVSTPQTGLDSVAAAAKSYKSSSVSPSPRDRDTAVSFSTNRSVSPRSVASSVADVKSIQSPQGLRSSSPAPSIRSTVSLSSSLEQPVVVGRIAEDINAGGVSDSKNVSCEAKNDLEGANIQAAAKKVMVESHRLAKEQAQLQQEKAAMIKSSGALIAARLIAKRGEEAAKAEELVNAAVMSQAKSVLSKSTQFEVLCPRPQRVTQHSILSAQQNTGTDRPSSLASNYSASVNGHSMESDTNESAFPVSQSLSDHLRVPWLDMVRSESCPPGDLNPPRRPSISASSTLSAVKSEPRSTAARRTISDAKAYSTHSSSRPISAASSQVLALPPRRLTKMSKIFQPFHSYNRFGAGTNKSVSGISSSVSRSPSSMYGNAEASLSTMSLPAPRTIQDDQNGNQRLSRLSAELAPMRTPFRTTMRKPEKKKHMFNAEKPWKHLIVSGTISENERKRYGALWAANKGTLLPSEMSDCVHNLVVRKIWERSRLNRDMLEKIWDLVSREKQGYLTQEEFLVGTWVVDQCLYGRKLPLQLSPEVWSGIGRLGIRIGKSRMQQQHHHHHHHHHHYRPQPRRRRSH
ncbi:hypothetical protein V1505DRAFT_319589 [Lipomyces doorenjongii]